MRKNILLIIFLFPFISCAIEGEVFRLQNRVKNWYQILNNSEKSLFIQDKSAELGILLDEKEKTNQVFQEAMRQIRIDEAIMSFNGEQTVSFFYRILLKDLVKFSYEEFMNVLSPIEKINFIQYGAEIDFSDNNKIQSVFQRAKNHYGFSGFSDVQILEYYKKISLPAIIYPTVYEMLSFLARYRSMEELLKGDIKTPLQSFENLEKNLKSRRIPTRKQAENDKETWESLKERAFLQDLSNEEYISLIYSVILPNMDEDVSIKTINNIRNRFRE